MNNIIEALCFPIRLLIDIISEKFNKPKNKK
jgi:hypothetical protein